MYFQWWNCKQHGNPLVNEYKIQLLRKHCSPSDVYGIIRVPSPQEGYFVATTTAAGNLKVCLMSGLE